MSHPLRSLTKWYPHPDAEQRRIAHAEWFKGRREAAAGVLWRGLTSLHHRDGYEEERWRLYQQALSVAEARPFFDESSLTRARRIHVAQFPPLSRKRNSGRKRR
jgi:hypothetical protein